jgi:acyl-CoA synthetase (AMP-forming)/AMP-acid ligase II
MPNHHSQHYLDAPTLWQLVTLRAYATPDAPMLIDADGTTQTFAQFAREAERLAAGLHARGIGPGTVVTWQLPTRSTSLVLSVALARLSAVQNPIIHLYGRKEVSAILAQNRSAVYIVPAPAEGERDYLELAATVCAALESPPQLIALEAGLAQNDISLLPAAPADDGVARWVYYTSGTTAAPKGALHTDATLMAAGRVYGMALGVGPCDVGTIIFPIAHVGGSMNLVMMLMAGMSSVLLPRFQMAETVAMFRRCGVTLSSGSTAHYMAFLAAQREQPETPLVPTLRILSGGGAAKPPELYFEVRREMDCVITHSYGMTEAPMICGASPRHLDEQLAFSDGEPVPSMQVKIVRPDGELAAAGEAGEIRVKGATVCKGYTDPALNNDAFDADGFFRTGDIGMLRADGHVALTGRLKDVIIRKGENISAREIEDILYEHPKVAAVAVIGLPDRERGERVCAVIEVHDAGSPLDFAEMVAFFEAAGTMRQKIPEQLEIVERLPRNETFNKILKFKLREQFGQTA